MPLKVCMLNPRMKRNKDKNSSIKTYLEKTRSHILDLIDDHKKSNERKMDVTMIICCNYDC